MRTAEWICVKCGTTNRKLVGEDTGEVLDRCVHCRAQHAIHPDDRPVRWNAALVK